MRVRCQQTRSLSVGVVIVRWHLHILSHLWGWNVWSVLYDQKVFKPMNIDFAFEALWQLSHLQIWQVWIHCQWKVAPQNRRRGRMQKNKETSSDQTTSVQGMTCRHQQKLLTWCVAFRESVLQSLTRATWADVNKINASECDSVPVLQCVCMIENVSSCALLTRWMTEKVSIDTFLFWLICGACAKNPIKSLKIHTQAVWSTDRSILGLVRSVIVRSCLLVRLTGWAFGWLFCMSKLFNIGHYLQTDKILSCLTWLQVTSLSVVLNHCQSSWPWLKVMTMRSVENLTCWLSFVTHFTVDQDETWCGCDAIQTEHPDTKEREDFLDQGNECWFA